MPRVYLHGQRLPVGGGLRLRVLVVQLTRRDAAWVSHAAIHASAVGSVMPSPMRRLRVAARRVASMRSGVNRRVKTLDGYGHPLDHLPPTNIASGDALQRVRLHHCLEIIDVPLEETLKDGHERTAEWLQDATRFHLPAPVDARAARDRCQRVFGPSGSSP